MKIDLSGPLIERLQTLEQAARHFADEYDLIHSTALFGRVTSGEIQSLCFDAIDEIDRLRAENVRLEAEKDETIEWIAVVREELVMAGGEGGDRTVGLRNLRALVRDRDHLRAEVERLTGELENVYRCHGSRVEELADAWAELDTAEVRAARYRGALEDVCDSGVEIDDARLDYLTVQIERSLWNQAHAITGRADHASAAQENANADD